MKGSMIWNLQRYSSLVILCYLLYVSSFIVLSEGPINFFDWTNFFLSFQTRFFTSVACIFILLHAYIGLWTVGTDYLTERTLGFLNKSLSKIANIIRKTYLFSFVLLGTMYLILILYIIWL
tara:strand:+ start:517 stop:879 length:363 start_codon:yes stop_codon:yes gene_type:complete